MSDTVDVRFAPPQARVEDFAPGDVALAGRGVRLLAAVIDGVIAGTAIWGLGRIPLLKPILQNPDVGLLTWRPTALLLGLSVFLVFQGWWLVTRGQTIGKMLCKLRIVRADGSKVGAWRLLGLRYGVGFILGINSLASMLYGLVDSLLIFRASRKCLHDSIADTKVIKL